VFALRHAPALVVLVNTPVSVPAYIVAGVFGSSASERTDRFCRPELDLTQLPAPVVER
jgi:hypothetical protein